MTTQATMKTNNEYPRPLANHIPPGANEWYGKTLQTLAEVPSDLTNHESLTDYYRSWPEMVKKLPPLPTMYDLPSENPEDPGMPDIYHPKQAELLTQTFQPPHHPVQERLVATDLHVYYDTLHPTWYKRPDWFVVLNVPLLYYNDDIRLSYVRWQERADPYIVAEFLSPSTRNEDLGRTTRRSADHPPTKWEVYEQILRVPYYIIFDHHKDELQIFQLVQGSYQAMNLPDNRLWIPALQIGVGLWQGDFSGMNDRLWLRWYDAHGNWIPTGDERAEQEQQRAEQERQRAESAEKRAEQERQRAESAEKRAEKLMAQLRALGIEPDSL